MMIIRKQPKINCDGVYVTELGAHCAAIVFSLDFDAISVIRKCDLSF